VSTFGFDGGPASPPEVPRKPLVIELVPAGSWGDNLRSRFTKARWDALRKAQYRRANYKCECCGESGVNQGYAWPVECHEIWSYDESTRIQKLEGLIALCPGCHRVKHSGRTISVDGPKGMEEVTHRLMMVNRWSEKQAVQHITEAFSTWERRSALDWTLDITSLQPDSSSPGTE